MKTENKYKFPSIRPVRKKNLTIHETLKTIKTATTSAANVYRYFN